MPKERLLLSLYNAYLHNCKCAWIVFHSLGKLCIYSFVSRFSSKPTFLILLLICTWRGIYVYMRTIRFFCRFKVYQLLFLLFTVVPDEQNNNFYVVKVISPVLFFVYGFKTFFPALWSYSHLCIIWLIHHSISLWFLYICMYINMCVFQDGYQISYLLLIVSSSYYLDSLAVIRCISGKAMSEYKQKPCSWSSNHDQQWNCNSLWVVCWLQIFLLSGSGFN